MDNFQGNCEIAEGPFELAATSDEKKATYLKYRRSIQSIFNNFDSEKLSANLADQKFPVVSRNDNLNFEKIRSVPKENVQKHLTDNFPDENFPFSDNQETEHANPLYGTIKARRMTKVASKGQQLHLMQKQTQYAHHYEMSGIQKAHPEQLEIPNDDALN